MKTHLLAGILFALGLATAPAQTYTFSTLAGLAGSSGSIDGTGANARLSSPRGVAVDPSGTIYLTDSGNHTIRKVTGAGVVTTVAGAPGQAGSADGSGSVARFNAPSGIAVDASGNLFVADTGNRTIRKITPGGVVSTLAGSAGQSGVVDGIGSAARFIMPRGIAVDSHGLVYVADLTNTIRAVTPEGKVTSLPSSVDINFPVALALDRADNVYVADRPSWYQGAIRIRPISPSTVSFATALVDYFNDTVGLAVDATGNVFIAEAGTSRILEARADGPNGAKYTLGGDVAGNGATDGPGSSARFNSPEGLAIDGAGNLYIVDTGNHTLRKGVPAAGASPVAVYPPFTTYQVVTAGHDFSLSAPLSAGSIQWQASTNNGSSWSNLADNSTYSGTNGSRLTIASASSADKPTLYRFVVTNNGTTRTSIGLAVEVLAGSLPHPTGVACGGSYIYISDSSTNTILKTDDYPYGASSYFVAGNGTAGTDDGTGASARFNQPGGLVAAPDGTLTVADTANGTIRRIAPNGAVTTLAGSPVNRGNADATGPAATFSSPRAVGQDSAGTVYVADSLNHTIRKISPAGEVTTLAGSAGSAGSSDGRGAAARFNNPGGLTVDPSGTVYVADTVNNTIRRINPAGEVSTLAGLAGVAGFTDGAGAEALFNRPLGLALDGSGNLYVADAGNSTIRKITPAGVVATLAGVPTIAGLMDGQGSSALFNQPEAICLNTAYTTTHLVVADTGNAVLRDVSLTGNVTTLELYPPAANATNSDKPAAGTISSTPASAPAAGSSTAAAGSSGGGALDGCFVGLLGLLGLLGRGLPQRRPAKP